MAGASRIHGDHPVILVDNKLIPKGILKDSVLVHLAAAYFHIGKRMEQKTQCSQTRGFVLSTLCAGATLNQNQIATLLGLDRTVVHRTIKSLIREKLVSEKKAPSGRALRLELTPKGIHYRAWLIQQRRAVDAGLRKQLSRRQFATLLRLLRLLSSLDF
jgi:DNA-binding MarR family transcriptional regulator